MPWYYAGPDSKPVGPFSTEEMHARRASGAIQPETYVIAQPALPGQPSTWKRYGEVFPTPPMPSTGLPPLPTAASAPGMAAHPLFPSAHPPSPGGPVFRPAAWTPPPAHASNTYCMWGFALGVLGFPCLLCAGIGFFLGIAGFIVSAMGLIQVRRDRTQSGAGLAICGLVASGITVLVALIFGACLLMKSVEGRDLTTTEQTSSDTDSR